MPSIQLISAGSVVVRGVVAGHLVTCSRRLSRRSTTRLSITPTAVVDTTRPTTEQAQRIL